MSNYNWDNFKKNPTASQAKVGDWFENPVGDTRKVIVCIDDDTTAGYIPYWLEKGEWVEQNRAWAAKLGHLRRWSQDGNR